MPPPTGSFTKQIFDEFKRYLGFRIQEGVPVVDADVNDIADSLLTQIRRSIQFGIGDGSPNDGWKIEESSSPSNNFTIKGGDGTAEGAGWIFENGFQAIIPSDIEYLSSDKDIHAEITGLTDTVLTDSSASFTPGELVGRDLVPDVDIPGTTFPIISNTDTTITVAAGLLAASAVGKHYRVNLTTPSGARTDKVYLDLFLDEADANEDADLLHDLGFPPTATEAAFRRALRTVVRVVEDVGAPGIYADVPTDYTDADGLGHFTVLLATLSRTAVADISDAQISDDRKGAGLLTVAEQDGSPSQQPVREIRFSNSTLTVLDADKGIVRVDVVEGSAAEQRSFFINEFNSVPGGLGDPSPGLMGDFKVQDYGPSVDREVKAQFNVPIDFDDITGSTFDLRLAFGLSIAGDGTDVEIEFEGSVDGVTAIGPTTVLIDTTGIAANTAVVTSPLITISEADVDDQSEIVIRIKRIGTSGGDGFSGDFRLLSLVPEYPGESGIEIPFSFSTEEFLPTDESTPANGSSGDFRTTDFDPASDEEVKDQWIVPANFTSGKSITVKAKFLMSTASIGDVRLSLEGSINNSTSFGPTEITIDPSDSSGVFEIRTLLTIPNLNPFDSVLLKIKRLGTDVVDTHTGDWKLLSIIYDYLAEDADLVRVAEFVVNTTLDLTRDAVFFNTDSGALTCTLPASPPEGKRYEIKNIGTSANSLTVDGNGNNIDDDPTFALSDAESLTIIFASSKWRIM